MSRSASVLLCASLRFCCLFQTPARVRNRNSSTEIQERARKLTEQEPPQTEWCARTALCGGVSMAQQLFSKSYEQCRVPRSESVGTWPGPSWRERLAGSGVQSLAQHELLQQPFTGHCGNDRHVWSSRTSQCLGHTGIFCASVEVCRHILSHRGKSSGSIVRRRQRPVPSICDGSTLLTFCLACLCPQYCREKDGRQIQRRSRGIPKSTLCLALQI